MSRVNPPNNSPRKPTVFETINHALFPNTGIPVPVRHGAEGRAELSKLLPPHPQEVFPKAVTFVHQNMRSHGHGLETKRANAYGDLTQKIENKQLSNSTGFGSAAVGWARDFLKSPNAEAAVGAGFNTLGFLAAGAVDSYQQKTGGRPISTFGPSKDQE